MLSKTGIYNVFILVLAICIHGQAIAQNGTWETKAPMLTATLSPAAEVINGVLYVAGGNNGGALAVLQTYDPATDTWSARTPMPGGRYAGNGAGVINGILYVAGGWNWPASGIPQNNLWAYDPATDAWSALAVMPTLSACGATWVANGKLYVHTPCNGYSGYTNFLHVYDPVANAWSALAGLPNAHSEPAFGVINGKFYIAGGGDSSGITNSLDVYDPATNTWNTLAPMPAPVAGPASGVINGKLYVAGGYNGTAYVNTVYVYDPAANTWTTDTPMPAARGNTAAGIINGKLYVAGGSNANGVLNTLEVFTPQPSLPTTKDQCKSGGWQAFGVFRNQGDCVSFVATKGKNP